MFGRSLDFGVIVALSWLFAAGAVTAIVGPDLGLRGWCWLLLHHTLCGIGTTHELRRARQRTR